MTQVTSEDSVFASLLRQGARRTVAMAPPPWNPEASLVSPRRSPSCALPIRQWLKGDAKARLGDCKLTGTKPTPWCKAHTSSPWSAMCHFKHSISPNKWSSVKLKGVGVDSIYEIIHVLPQDRLQVCLVKTGEMTPFINSLEIRPLKNGTYDTQSGSLITVSRFYFPPTKQVISTNSFYDVPQRVVKTAAVPANSSQPLTLNLTLDETTAESYIYMHFAEIQNLEANETREFNVTYNGDQEWFSYFRPPNFKITTASSREAMSSPDGNFNFTLAMTGNSTLPPLINAVEIYEVLDLRQLETDEDEVSAMVNIKRSYELMKKVSWQGDPCAPQFLLWEGLKCSYPNADSPMITSLNFKESNLTGSITLEFAKLTQLIELLSKNDLSGEIPSFFADMKSLKLINLNGNPNLNSTIPDSLQQRLKKNSLTLMYDELHYHLLSSTKVFSSAVSQVRWETSTSCPQPLFHGVPRGLCGDFSLSSCLRWTVKGSCHRIRDWIAIVEP
ncbi:hypothetical protein Bca4012_029824 [Brassica carinata]|uniref:Malectin-like domain-containing protein n=1 Tax=Brassica carinata TaxID=52824 RepID=A0A8X7UTJ6_BRACI|nr:hypothetical protein Bca52824_048775 [Brassica carinata]